MCTYDLRAIYKRNSEKQSYQYINDSLENESSEPPVKIKKLEKNSFQDFYESHNLFENESPETVPKPKQLKAEYLEDNDEDHDGNHDENDDSCETIEASDLKSQRKRYALEKIRQQIKETTKLFQVELEEKYDWLGKQVVFEINKIQNEELQEHTAWDIQQILRESIQRDRQLRETEETSSTTQPSSSEVCSWMINAKDRDPLDK
ncbi:uncharacterized protein LOC129919312 isoform X2 [Episyrphus balteatus]|uniref:uncharacterized protein LOC129919312 isoform X2 n=1 Tax=Episyrphus balteatus TaxID=286459 RepID=UPI0024857B4C|nr:uncharacterized protein LOC129919312 isoform X2 [Episyrphus balteatus]